MSAPATSRHSRQKNQPPAHAGRLTQGDLAGLAEIDRRHVQRIEAGTANPGIDVICRLRRALHASWEDLLQGLDKSSGG